MAPGKNDRTGHKAAGRGAVLHYKVDLSILAFGSEHRSQFFCGESMSLDLAVYFSGPCDRFDTDVRGMRVDFGNGKIFEIA